MEILERYLERDFERDFGEKFWRDILERDFGERFGERYGARSKRRFGEIIKRQRDQEGLNKCCIIIRMKGV